MIRYLVALALCAVLSFGAAAYGAGGCSFFGPTGLIGMPTTDSLDTGQFRVFANYLTRDDYDETPYGVNVGLGYGIEIGATQIHETDVDDNINIVNVKWTAYKGGLVMPAVAVGAINALDNEDFLGTIITPSPVGEIMPFVVAGKSLTIPDLGSLSVHAGYIAGTLDRPMFGAQLGLSSNLEIIAEYIPDFTELSFGARYTTASGLGIQAASLDGDFTGGIFYTHGIW